MQAPISKWYVARELEVGVAKEKRRGRRQDGNLQIFLILNLFGTCVMSEYRSEYVSGWIWLKSIQTI